MYIPICLSYLHFECPLAVMLNLYFFHFPSSPNMFWMLGILWTNSSSVFNLLAKQGAWYLLLKWHGRQLHFQASCSVLGKPSNGSFPQTLIPLYRIKSYLNYWYKGIEWERK